jgi:hypothetical protein
VRYESGAVIRVGDQVEIGRDEEKYPSRGTWPRYRGRVGTVVSINQTDREVGVNWETGDRPIEDRRADSWFKPWEVRPR